MNVHDGDLEHLRWTAQPIELLVSDPGLAPRADLHQLQQLLPSLVPGRGLLVRRGLNQPSRSWGLLRVVALLKHVQILGWGADAVVLGAVRAIPLHVLRSYPLVPERVAADFELLAAAAPDKRAAALVRMAGAVALARLGGGDEAREMLASPEAVATKDGGVKPALRDARAALRRMTAEPVTS